MNLHIPKPEAPETGILQPYQEAGSCQTGNPAPYVRKLSGASITQQGIAGYSAEEVLQVTDDEL
jgi:hypothetical protein